MSRGAADVRARRCLMGLAIGGACLFLLEPVQAQMAQPSAAVPPAVVPVRETPAAKPPPTATGPITTGSAAQRAAGATAPAAVAAPKSGRCTRMAFAVNDYGKEGPTRDAKALLDKHIATWAKDKGIKTYTVGKKTVTCELFLDFGLFDEHTCKAQASVCW